MNHLSCFPHPKIFPSFSAMLQAPLFGNPYIATFLKNSTPLPALLASHLLHLVPRATLLSVHCFSLRHFLAKVRALTWCCLHPISIPVFLCPVASENGTQLSSRWRNQHHTSAETKKRRQTYTRPSFCVPQATQTTEFKGRAAPQAVQALGRNVAGGPGELMSGLTICAAPAAPAAGLACVAMEAHQKQLVMMTTMKAMMPQIRKQITTGAVSVGRPGTCRDTGVEYPKLLTQTPPRHS
jgi:hypothetical protein